MTGAVARVEVIEARRLVATKEERIVMGFDEGFAVEYGMRSRLEEVRGSQMSDDINVGEGVTAKRCEVRTKNGVLMGVRRVEEECLVEEDVVCLRA